MLNKNVAYIEGEAKAEDLIYKLADRITAATWKDEKGDPVTNRWEEVFRQGADFWVTYKEASRTATGAYTHKDGKSYPVYKTPNYVSQMSSPNNNDVDANGFIKEFNASGTSATGQKIRVTNATYTDLDGNQVVVPYIGLLMAATPDGVAILNQKRTELDGTTITDDPQWNEYKLDGYLDAAEGDWASFLSVDSWITGRNSLGSNTSIRRTAYSFSERYYTADPVNFYENTVVLKCVPDTMAGMTPLEYFVMFKHPQGQYNYFDTYYGIGFTGTNMGGDPKESYIRACNPTTVGVGKTPVVVNQKEAEAAFKRQGTSAFVVPKETWDLDIDGKTEMKSPPSHYHFGADSVVTWVPNKKRRADYFVSYYISLQNDRLTMVIEGDPSPDIDGFYRSFGYFGRIIPFNQYDVAGNFAMTVGMGHLEAPKTGFVANDILQNSNANYAGFGRYTSNGMYSVSMLGTRANVLFQAHYPAFITELPNYSSVGTIPKELSRLITEKNGFQASEWTERYHGSPIYLAHQVEGYRGYMDGVVAVNDHNLINMDELVVDTEIAKPGGGTYEEVYKFFSLKTPVSFFDTSANPDGMTIAILKEVR